jgi:ABC-2 type transport system permease protein
MRNILTIAKREMHSYLNTPTAYIVIVAFLLPSFFLYWRQTLITNEASLRSFFSLLPWFLLLVIPALTMKTLADEQRKNTVELLLSHALTEWQIIIGKYLGVLAFYTLILAATLSLPLTLARWSSPDWGIIAGQYIGTIFMGSGMIAMGILISTWFSQSTTAFLAAAGINFAWIILGLDLVTLALPWPFNQIAHQLAFLTHTDQLARGLIELKDISYFLTTTAVLLSMAAIRLSQFKLIENKPKQTRLYTGAVLISALGVVFHLILTSWPLNLDLTADHRFTLSAGTKTTLAGLPDIVSITLYASRELPAPVQLIKQDIEDILRDYAGLGNNKIKISIISPEAEPQLEQEATNAGINKIQFNTISSGKFSIEAGYLGIVIRYGNETETIPYVQNSGTLEYDLTQRIRKLTVENRPTIEFFSGLNSKSTFTDLAQWKTDLETQYQVKLVSLEKLEDQISANLLIVPGPKESIQEATAGAKIKEYLNNQGKVFLLLDAVDINTQLGIATPVDHGWDQILSEYGLALSKNLAYDVQLNENIRLGQGLVQYILPYPYWIRALAAPAGKLNFNYQDSVLLAWPSSLKVNEDPENIQITELLTTGKTGGVTEGTLSIAPETAPKQGQGISILLAAMSEKSGAKLALVSDSDLAAEEFYQNSPANQMFLSSIVDTLVADEAMARVPRRQIVPVLLDFQNPQDPIIAQYGNIIGAPVIIGLFGFWWLRRRHKLTERTYRN